MSLFKRTPIKREGTEKVSTKERTIEFNRG